MISISDVKGDSMDILFKNDEFVFSYRVGGILIHNERDTYEVPGGHREAGESILETAKRELQEETGAIRFDMKPLCVYSVTGKTRVNDMGEESFGLLCYAEITEFATELHSEMEKIVLLDELPEEWTYPLIQPKLIEKYLQMKNTIDFRLRA